MSEKPWAKRKPEAKPKRNRQMNFIVTLLKRIEKKVDEISIRIGKIENSIERKLTLFDDDVDETPIIWDPNILFGEEPFGGGVKEKNFVDQWDLI